MSVTVRSGTTVLKLVRHGGRARNSSRKKRARHSGTRGRRTIRFTG